jgi:hypothetical protein
MKVRDQRVAAISDKHLLRFGAASSIGRASDS